MSATEIATIFGALAVLITAIGGILGYWNTRQANQIKQLSEDADARAKQRLAERESDRLDREAKEKEFVFWRDAHRDLSKQYTDEHASFVTLATKHDEFRRDYDNLKIQLQDLISKSSGQATEIIHLKGEQDKALSTISSMHDERLAAIRTYEDQLSRANDESVRKQSTLQQQIDELTENVKQQAVKIKALQDQLREFGDANMQLGIRVEHLQNENDRLLGENKRLVGELARIGVFVGPYDYAGYGNGNHKPDDDPTPPTTPTDPGHKAPIPFEDKPSALLPTGTGG